MWPFERRTDNDFRTEIDAHIALEMDRLIAEGVDPDQARDTATRTFGNVTAAQERFYESGRILWLEEGWPDGRYAFRLFRKSPGFTTVTILTLALAIGANTAIFSLIEAVLLRPLAVNAPHQLFFIAHGPAEDPRMASNYPLFERMRQLTSVFAGVTAYRQGDSFKVSNGDVVEITDGQIVSGNYHGLLGVPMALGRGFTSEDDRPGSEGLSAVISHSYWTSRFGGDPNAVGRTIVVDGQNVSIIGVTAQGFDGLDPGERQDITLPIAMRLLSDPGFLTKQNSLTSMPLVARLKPGVSEPQAAAAVETAFHQFFLEPANQWYRRDSRIPTSHMVSAAHGSASLRSKYSQALSVLIAIAAVVLLIGCVNIAHLMLARGTARAREVATRMAVGAGRLRLLRQFVTETVLLVSMGALLGLLIALWSARSIATLMDVVLDVQANARVLAFTAGVSVLAAIIFGLAPAFVATRVRLVPTLRQTSGIGWWPRRWHAPQLLVGSQMALCVLLIVGAGLLVRTLQNLQNRAADLDTDNVLVFSLDAPDSLRSGRGMQQFCQQLLDRLAARPGVIASSCSSSVPVDMRGTVQGIQLPGIEPAQDAGPVWVTSASSEYFKTFGLPVVRGRALTAQDSMTSPVAVVVSESLARQYFPAQNPLGQLIHWRGRPGELMSIVGVARDTVQDSFRDEPYRMVYTPLVGGPVRYVALRSVADPIVLASSIRADVRSLNGSVLVESVWTMEDKMDRMLTQERVIAMLSTWFGIMAVVLACIGLYGVMSHEVNRRKRDIGIQLALGARPTRVLSQILCQTALVSGVGILLGLVTAIGTTRILGSLLYGLTPRDPATLAVAAAVLATIALMTGYLPARRAANVDPIIALRNE